MQNFIKPGHTMTLVAPYDRTSGQGALVGSLFGVATGDVLSGASGEFEVEGVYSLDKNSAEAWTVGEKLYWDNTNKVVTATATGNTLIGCAAAIAANPSSKGEVRLNGTVA